MRCIICGKITKNKKYWDGWNAICSQQCYEDYMWESEGE